MKSIYRVNAQTMGNDVTVFFQTNTAAKEWLDKLFDSIGRNGYNDYSLVGTVTRMNSNGGEFFDFVETYKREIKG